MQYTITRHSRTFASGMAASRKERGDKSRNDVFAHLPQQILMVPNSFTLQRAVRSSETGRARASIVCPLHTQVWKTDIQMRGSLVLPGLSKFPPGSGLDGSTTTTTYWGCSWRKLLHWRPVFMNNLNLD